MMPTERPAPDPVFPAMLAAARGGDRDALDRLLECTRPRLEAAVQARLGPALKARLGASDVVQSTWLDVMRGIHAFEGDGEDAFVSWMTRIMENNVRDKDRFFAARKRRQDAVAAALSDVAPRVHPSPSGDLARSEEVDRLSAALRTLPLEYRRILDLRLVQRRSHREVADALGRSEGAVRMLLCRARAALALALDRGQAAVD